MLPPKKSVAKIQLKSGGCRKSIDMSQDIHSQSLSPGLAEADVWMESAATMWADALSFLASHFLPFAATCQRFTEISFKGRALFLLPLSGVVLCLFLSICPKKRRKVKLVLWDYREKKKILWSFFSILARNTASTVIMVSNKGHGIASSKITTYFSVGEIRPGKTPTEFNRGETDFGWNNKLCSRPAVRALDPSLKEVLLFLWYLPPGVLLIIPPSLTIPFSLSHKQGPLSILIQIPLSWNGGVQVVQISTNCN